jgi:hypothetical protein
MRPPRCQPKYSRNRKSGVTLRSVKKLRSKSQQHCCLSGAWGAKNDYRFSLIYETGINTRCMADPAGFAMLKWSEKGTL